MNRTLILVVCIAITATTPSYAQKGSFETQFRKFAEQHCVSCHGPDVQKRKLRVDNLAIDFADKDTSATWMRVLDRVSRGEMPPKNRERPPEKETMAVLAGLQKQLHESSLAKQQAEGRVVLRRLNRTEYETTLRDLLGAAVEVKGLLPDDNSASGFDNVSAVLDISAVHLLRYQEAAERALRTIIPSRPPWQIKDRRTGKQITEKMPLFKDLMDKVIRLDGDTLILHCKPYSHLPCSTAPVPQPGRYRIRASVYAVNTGGKPLPVRLVRDDVYGRDESDVRGVRDVPEGKPTVIEGEFDLKARQAMIFVGWSLPTVRDVGPLIKNTPLDKYTGPGLAVQWVEIEGPLDPWPPAGYDKLFAGVPLKATSVVRAEAEGRPVPPQDKRTPDSYIYDPLMPAPAKAREDAERLIRAFLPLAFRRPVDKALQDYYIKMVHDALDKKATFAEAMLLGYKAILCSPHFLYLTEPLVKGSGSGSAKVLDVRLDEYALASRLSFFLWSSMPDAELLRVAGKGELTKPEVLRTQVERLLNDPKAHRFTADFAGQWLDLRSINATSPDPQIYGEFDDFLFWSMPRETELYFEEILKHDRSVLEFVHSDWSYLNQRLAQHYGIPNVEGGELRKVKLPVDCKRGGVLTHASILKVTADGTRTSPVIRGKWVLDKIVGLPPAPPPPDIPAIDPDIRGATTIRQQLDKHRDTPACAGCHRHIDPPGFALENFDVIGGWRDFYRGTRPTRGGAVDLANYPGRKIYRGLDVEKGGESADGKPFKDIDEYKQLLLADKDQLIRNLVRKLIVYGTGAEIQFADREVVESLVTKSREQKYGFRSMIHEVVQSRVFVNK